MKEFKDIRILENVSLKKYNTYKIEGKAKYLAFVSSLDSLLEFLGYLKENNISYLVIGNGSNIVIDEYFDGVIIKLDLNEIKVVDDVVKAEAGVMLGSLVKESLKYNLTGLEWAMNIPGTVGGSIVGNAGAYQKEMFDNIVSVKVLTKDGEVLEKNKDEFLYQYRHTNIKELGLIVLEGTFLLQKGNREESLKIISDRNERRMQSQPLDMPSAGSVFRNPSNDFAGRLIEEAGLKGTRIGGAEVSLKHANFIVNTGDATSKDIKNLIKLIKDEVKKQFDVDLILEQEILEWM